MKLGNLWIGRRASATLGCRAGITVSVVCAVPAVAPVIFTIAVSTIILKNGDYPPTRGF